MYIVLRYTILSILLKLYRLAFVFLIVSVVALFYFGWVDLIYYISQGETIPNTLPWLNNQLLTTPLQGLGDSPDFEKSELVLLNALGILVILGGWFKIIYIHKKLRGKRR